MESLTAMTVSNPARPNMTPLRVSSKVGLSPLTKVNIQVFADTGSPSLARVDTARSVLAM